MQEMQRYRETERRENVWNGEKEIRLGNKERESERAGNIEKDREIKTRERWSEIERRVGVT